MGNELGRGCAGAARRAAFTAVALELALIALVTGALLAGQRLWAALFTDDAEVRRCLALHRSCGFCRAPRLLAAVHAAADEAAGVGSAENFYQAEAGFAGGR